MKLKLVSLVWDCTDVQAGLPLYRWQRLITFSSSVIRVKSEICSLLTVSFSLLPFLFLRLRLYQEKSFNRVTPELRLFWVFRTNKLLQIKSWGIVPINGKYIKHEGYSIVNVSVTWSYNGKSLFVPTD